MSRSAVFARIPAAAAAVALVAGLSACGGGGSPTGSSGSGNTTPPPSTVTTTLPTFTFNSVAPSVVVFTDVTINGTGTLSLVADWTFPSSDIDVYVTATSCGATNITNLQSGCAAVGRTTATSVKPERLTVNVTQGNYRLWIANFGPSTESGTLQATATVTR
ncbi:MAG: hypothetical protein ABW221_01065 [Vicinamibacteria bacterium]